MSDYVKNLDNALLQKHGVRLYGSHVDMYDIINDFLEDNRSEQAFYVVDLGEITSSLNKWMMSLPMVKPYYAIKCNPNPVLLEALASLGVNFDCASENEIKTIIEITKDPTRIIFANPCKMSSQIRYARANDVDLMTFDCEEELYKIKLYHPYAKLILRLAVDDSMSVCKFNKKFGCKVDQINELLVIAKTLKLNVTGFSFHVGSNCASADTYFEALRICKNAFDMAHKLDIYPTMIDIGGGFPGIDPKNGGVKFDEIATRINDGINEFFPKYEEDGLQFIAEPGRYFAQSTHTLVLNVIGKKIHYNGDEKNIIYYLNDGVYGSFNCIFFDHEKPTILPFNERDGKHFKSRIFGPTCDSIDLISDEVMLPELAIGEWVYVENFGAYTIAASSGFNGFRTTLCRYILRS
jgi:ornithine decarboxylase